MPTLFLPPEASDYKVKPKPTKRRVELDGGRSKMKSDKINSAWLIDARWRLDRSKFLYFNAFYETAIDFGSEVFDLANVILNNPVAQTYEVAFYDEWELVEQSGHLFVVEAELEASPLIVNHAQNQAIIDAFEADNDAYLLDISVDPSELAKQGEIADQFNNVSDVINLDISGFFDNPQALTLLYSAGNLPDGLSINSSSGVITGTITGNPTAYDSSVVASAIGGGIPIQHQFTWNVT